MTYRVVHRTDYAYESPVSASYGELYLLPRASDTQNVMTARVDIDPPPDSYGERIDFFGNCAASFAILQTHSILRVTMTSVVEVRGRPLPTLGSGPAWEDAGRLLHASYDPEGLVARQFALESPHVPITAAIREYAAPSFVPGRPLVDVIADLTHRINTEFAYKPGVTDLQTTPDELLDRREGVCQDFAHLQISCLRAYGLAARYVSGYLETIPPPSMHRLQGADVSHAWLSAYVPTIGWIDVDPTNDIFVADRHICTAWGRDYGDISPVKGVIFTEAKTNTMTVSVDVTRAAAPTDGVA